MSKNLTLCVTLARPQKPMWLIYQRKPALARMVQVLTRAHARTNGAYEDGTHQIPTHRDGRDERRQADHAHGAVADRAERSGACRQGSGSLGTSLGRQRD